MPPPKSQSSRRARQSHQCKINLTPCHSTAWHYSNNQPHPTARRSIRVVLPTVGVDWLDAIGMAAAAAAGATNSWCIHSREQRANVRITSPRCTSASKTETTATLMVATLTMGTPAGRVPNQAHAQSTRDKDQHDEWVSCGPPQDNSTFGLRPRTPRPTPAISFYPSKLAAASSPCQLHHLYPADDAPRTLPQNALHGAAMLTYPFSGCSACSSCTHTSCAHNDDALLRTVPSASSLLTIRGKQQ
jgi:hypothetical protein